MATHSSVQQRTFEYNGFLLQYLPYKEHKQKIGYKETIRLILTEMSSDEHDYIGTFDKLVRDITLRDRKEIKDMRLETYVDDVEYTFYDFEKI